MDQKTHLYFRNPEEGVKEYKFSTRDLSRLETEDEKNYEPMKAVLRRSIANYYSEKDIRDGKRSENLRLPVKIDFIEIQFFDTFSSDFEGRYYSNFGLSIINLSKYNKQVIFAVVSEERFESFINELRKFLVSKDPLSDNTYNHDIRFIQSFKFYSSSERLQSEAFESMVTIELMENAEIFEKFLIIRDRLISYLRDKNITPEINQYSNTIEISGHSQEILDEIIDNFDIVQKINNNLGGLIRPSRFNVPTRSYGFTISNALDELPIIGIIDTGIDSMTPLTGIIINTDNSFDATNTSPVIDNVDHGTGVAAFAALGNQLCHNNIGSFISDSKLLSIKILDTGIGDISTNKVINLIRKAHQEHDIKIFVLTITFSENKKNDSNISKYAYELDKLSYEYDLLIFISTGNKMITVDRGKMYSNGISYPKYYDDETSNLSVPAESMNNVCVGAIADNFESTNKYFVLNKDYPSLYTRRFHLTWDKISSVMKNKKLYKPDLLNCGGDYDIGLGVSDTGIKKLSSQPSVFFEREVGTSFSAPLTANIAAKILKIYPSLKSNMQTVKAIIINSTKTPKIEDSFKAKQNTEITHLIGNGVPKENDCLYSSEEIITMILEDEISPNTIKTFPIKLPKYLIDIKRENALLNVNATLCFNIDPVDNNHLAYCPIHIAFAFFKNLPLQAQDRNNKNVGINGNKMEYIKLRTGWSEDYYFGKKMLSNCQKVIFNISKSNLIDEKFTLKIAINCKLHKLLLNAQKQRYNKKHKFSLVFSIRENSVKGKISGKLYSEMLAINNLNAIGIAEADATIN